LGLVWGMGRSLVWFDSEYREEHGWVWCLAWGGAWFGLIRSIGRSMVVFGVEYREEHDWVWCGAWR
jgi:hypothetical protein